jgi:SAM-dependent methyltransferase
MQYNEGTPQVSSLELKDLAPPFVRRLSRHMKAVIRNLQNRGLSAQEVFTRVYATKMWGTGSEAFYSGPGSNADAAKPYADFVTSWIKAHDIRSVVDLGCGDFRVGRMITSCGISYTGVDVVAPLIDDNNRRFGNDQVHFQCLDITSDNLPAGDLCLIREVFQHISNAQIVAVLARMEKYQYVLFTDVQPEDVSNYRINKDKVHGASSRLVHGSCLRLDAPPFGVKGMRLVFETNLPYFDSYAPYGGSFKLRTFLWRGRP